MMNSDTMGDIALSVKNLDIVYMPYHSMRVRNLFGNTGTKLQPIRAIREMSFSVQKGEVIGIVGRNGSGKTTLLRAIAGIFDPDAGEINLYGNRVSLMALGVGFDPELSGRENIMLSGMMLGFSRKEIREHMDEIIAFSELSDFIDYPVRAYSSGMYSKLAFSITSFLETDIMLIDEVLSVGDIAFQDKSRNKMRELIAQRKHTVLLVSHNVGLLQDVCDRVIWMDAGSLRQFGRTDRVLKEYSDFMLTRRDSEENSGVSDKSVKKHTWLYGHWEQAWEKVSEIIPDLEGRLDGFLNQWMNKEFAEQADKQIVAVGQDFEYISRQLKDMYNLGTGQIVPFRKWLAEQLSDPEICIRPVRARLEACTLCQLNCKDCYMRKENGGTVGAGYLTFENFRQFLLDNPYIREIELSNSGEVFLNPDLVKILELAQEKNVGITLGNGVNLNTVSEEQLEALVKYGVRFITVSIDGATQEIYSIYRRNGNLERVLDNIRAINDLKKRYHSEFPALQWQFVVMEHNEQEIPIAEKMAEELGMRFFLKRDWGGYRRKEGQGISSSSINGNTGENIADAPAETERKEKAAQEDGISGDCAQMLFSPQINWDGRLLGCCRVFRSDWGVNVFEMQGLEKALRNMVYRKALCSHLGERKGTEDNPCKNCSCRGCDILAE